MKTPSSHKEIVEQIAKDLKLPANTVDKYIHRVFSITRSGVAFYVNRYSNVLITGLGRIYKSANGYRLYKLLKKEMNIPTNRKIQKYIQKKALKKE
jgi:hypothetical protein